MKKVKNQHYVPQLYLKNFSTDGKINVFDKAKDEIRINQHIKNVASSRYFHDIDIDRIEQFLEDDPLIEFPEIKEVFKKACKEQFLEKEFSEEIEPELKYCLNQILGYYTLLTPQGIDKSQSLNEETKFELSILLVIQHIRTKEFRVTVIEQMPQLQIEFLKKIDEKAGKDISKFDGIIAKYQDESFINLLHARYMMDKDFILRLSECIQKHIWYIGINETGNALYTSDNPIVKIEHKYDGIMSYSGFDSEGVEIVYPISDKLALIIRERKFHKSDEKYEMKYKKLSVEEVACYNLQQLKDSYRNIFSKEDNFGFAKDILEKNPSLKKIDKMRISIN